MAIKDWFKDKEEKDRWINQMNNHSLKINSVWKNRFDVEIRNEHYRQIDGDEFETKSEALRFAMSYMRTH